MKSKRKNLLALSLAAVGAIGAFASVSAESIQGNFPSKVRDEVRTAIKQAFTSGDYQGYLLTTKEYKVGVPVLTEAQFNTMVQANKLRTQGDIAGAKKLLDDAGIKPQEIGNKEKGIKATKTLTSTLTDAQKSVMEQAHTLMESGKKTEAEILLKNAGITLPLHEGKMKNTVSQ